MGTCVRELLAEIYLKLGYKSFELFIELVTRALLWRTHFHSVI